METSTPVSLPPIKTLLSETWQTFTKSILSLFLLSILWVCVGGMTSFLLIFLPLLGLGFFSTLKPQIASELLKNLAALPSQYWIISIGVFLIFIVLITFLGMAIQIAQLKVLDDPTNKKSLWAILKESFGQVIPLYLMQLVSGLLIGGGSLLLFIPGLVFGFLFAFTAPVLIFEKTKILDGLRRSVALVSSHFGEILVRFLLVFIAYILVVIFIPNLIIKLDEQTGLILIFVRMLLNILASWFWLAFTITLYKQVKQATPIDKKGSLLWILLVSILGWVASGLLIFLLIRTISSPKVLESLNKLRQKNTTRELPNVTYAPTSCELKLPVPQTTDTQGAVTRKWLFEEKTVGNTSFFILDNDVFPVKFVQGIFLGYKDISQRLSGNTFSVAFPGLNIYCVDNTRNFTLDEYANLAKTNKNFIVTADDKVRWGDLIVIPIQAEGTDPVSNTKIRDLAYLGVSETGKKLYYIRIWSAGENDPPQIQTDINLIISNIRFRETDVKGIYTQNAAPALQYNYLNEYPTLETLNPQPR